MPSGPLKIQLLPLGHLPWARARKTKPIRVKHMSAVLPEAALATKLLLQTLEAREPLDSRAMFCRGIEDDVWMQSSKALLAKYVVTDIDEAGWLVCVPKPENEALCVELTEPLLASLGYAPHMQEQGEGFVQALWGETLATGETAVQRFAYGDFLLGSPNNESDRWVVRRRLWRNSYEWL